MFYSVTVKEMSSNSVAKGRFFLSRKDVAHRVFRDAGWFVVDRLVSLLAHSFVGMSVIVLEHSDEVQ